MPDPVNPLTPEQKQRAVEASLDLLAQFADGIAKTSGALLILLEHADQERKNLEILLKS